MNTLLIINAIVIGAIGGTFVTWGSNVQSRLLGLVCTLTAMVNVAVLVKLIEL